MLQYFPLYKGSWDVWNCAHKYVRYNMSSEYLRSESSNITISILKYKALARAKSEAVVNISRLLKQNIKSCNAKRRLQRKRDV